ncbi:MAG: hypothetical protein J6J01_10565 [Oscillospiraceae bacterium]|nr:hypothetical protein [Oscillospiraceae bacterium]
MDENTVFDTTSDSPIDSGVDVTNTDLTLTEGVEGTDIPSDGGSATVVGGDTYVSVLSSDSPTNRVVTVNPYEIQEGDNSLLAMVNSVFGDYQPRTQTVTETYPDGSTVTYTEVIDGLGGLDYYWLGGVLVFCIVLWSFFKFLGGIFKVR